MKEQALTAALWAALEEDLAALWDAPEGEMPDWSPDYAAWEADFLSPRPARRKRRWGRVVLAAAAGTVAEAGFDPALGNYLVLDHGGGLTTTYGQLARNDFVAVDGQVEAGEQIGTVGKTGQATGYHLHFEVAENGTQVDPLDHLMPGRLADRT